jgi:uncharacterized protein YjdB
MDAFSLDVESRFLRGRRTLTPIGDTMKNDIRRPLPSPNGSVAGVQSTRRLPRLFDRLLNPCLHVSRTWLASLALLALPLAATAVTLNPVADTDNQSDVAAGTNANINISQFCTAFIKFDLSSVSGTVTNATLRVYFGGQAATTITVSTTSNDTWVEGGTKPTKGSTITTKALGATTAGYITFDVTAHTVGKMSGNKIVSVTLSNTLSGWSGLNSRQASSNKPELVVTTSGGGSVLVTGISITPASASIQTGSTTTLTATVTPSNATNKTLSWTSSNASVATVNSSGTVSGVTAGSANIVAHSTDGSAINSNNSAITVTVPAGGTTTLNPVADTDNQSDVAAGTNATINISQFCTPFIKFDLTGVSGSVTNATLRVYFGGGLPATTLNVSTTSNDTWVEGGTKPTTGSAITSQAIGATGTGYLSINLTAHVQTKMSGNKIVSVTLSDTGSGWMGLNSRQAASNKPELVITTSGGGGSVPVTGVTINPGSAFVTVNGTATFTPTVTPSNATNKTLTWASSNTTAATVNTTGVVTGHAVGSAGITAKSADGSNITSNIAMVTVSSGGGTATRPGYNTGNGFFVLNGKLYDANGVQFTIRGVNKLHWDSASPGIPATGANTERWVIDFNQPTATNIALMQQSISNHIVPMPGNWGATSCPPETELPGIVDKWVAQASAWKTLDRYMILNIANELGGGNSTVWRDAYITAIGRLRAAGYLCTIAVDAGGCGQDNDDIANYAAAIFNSDPQKNVIFDQHIYGNWGINGQPSWAIDLPTALDRLVATGLCCFVGEFGPGRNIGPSPTLITPGQIITACDSRGLGWLAWAWDDPAFNADDNWFAMSFTGNYNSSADLTTFGKDVVENTSYGLKARAVKQTHF